MSAENTDQYIIRRKLGEGGMGVVYLAEDTALERPVAIKELSRPAAPGQDATESRFQQEALALARLNHPNITHLYAFLPKGPTYWMVMEYVPGKTLEEWLHYRGKLNAGLASSILVQMLEGLQHAHRKGIIHRDLKPSNVMISEEGEVKIMDFGIARIRDSQRITRHGKSVGTLAYMAPEQIKGEEGDERTDVYAAGNILYELLSGHTPFEADTDYHLMKLKLEEAPKPLLATAPAELQKVVFKALDRQPARRYESVAALKEAIERSMQGRLLKPEVLNPMLSDLQQEESFVKAVREAPLRKLSGMVRSLPVRAAAGRVSKTLAAGPGRAWWLLGASVVLCALLLLWYYAGSSGPGPDASAAALPPAAVPAAADTALGPRKRQAPIIENQMMQNTAPQSDGQSTGAPSGGEREAPAERKGEAPARKAPSGGGNQKEAAAPSAPRAEAPAPPVSEPPAAAGPVQIPGGEVLRVVLDETLSSEVKERDGGEVHLHCDENVVVNGRLVIRRGAPVTGKIVDVRTSAARRAALIGFVIQHVQAVDGSQLNLRSERFRHEADDPGQPVYYQRGQSFTAELKGGRLR